MAQKTGCLFHVEIRRRCCGQYEVNEVITQLETRYGVFATRKDIYNMKSPLEKMLIDGSNQIVQLLKVLKSRENNYSTFFWQEEGNLADTFLDFPFWVYCAL